MSSKAIRLRRSAGKTVVAAGGGGGGGPVSDSTWGPQDATDDWAMTEGTSGMVDPTFTATPGAGAGHIGVDGSMSMGGYQTYAMMFDLDVPSGATVTSATLKVTTTSSGGNGSAEWFISDEDDNDTSEPGNASEAVAAVDRCTVSNWADSGETPDLDSTEYSIDVKDEIEDIIGRGGWSEEQSITLMLSGPVVAMGGTCTGDGSDTSSVETLASSSGKPNLTVVYSTS